MLERTDDGIVTRFTCENEPTTDDSGTTVTIDFAHDTIDHDVTEHITRKLNPERTLCGWSKNEVFVTNAEYKEYNECRVPDAWYFNGHEYKYSKYADSTTGSIEQDEALEIIDHINNTCASEIATLNQMLSDLDPLIK